MRNLTKSKKWKVAAIVVGVLMVIVVLAIALMGGFASLDTRMQRLVWAMNLSMPEQASDHLTMERVEYADRTMTFIAKLRGDHPPVGTPEAEQILIGLKQVETQATCESAHLPPLLNQGIQIAYDYTFADGAHLGGFVIEPTDCNL